MRAVPVSLAEAQQRSGCLQGSHRDKRWGQIASLGFQHLAVTMA